MMAIIRRNAFIGGASLTNGQLIFVGWVTKDIMNLQCCRGTGALDTIMIPVGYEIVRIVSCALSFLLATRQKKGANPP
jgi:hypothetical protein